MKFYSRLLLLSLLGLLVSGCNEEQELVMPHYKSRDKINEMILSFHNQLHANSRSAEHTFNIKGIFTETFKVSDSNKTRSSKQLESFDIHTVNLDFDGTPGYAILSDTPE